MPASAAGDSYSNAISGGSHTTPPPDVVVPSMARADGEANRMLDDNGNSRGQTRPTVVPIAPVPAVPVSAASGMIGAAQNASPASVPADNYLSHRMWMAQRPEPREEELLQPPIARSARQQFNMERPLALYPNALVQPMWPHVGPGRILADGNQVPGALPYRQELNNSALPRFPPLMPTVPIYSPSVGFPVGLPPYPMSAQVNPLNYFAGSRSAPPRFPRPAAWEHQAAAAPPMLFERVAPPIEQPSPMYHVLLEDPGASPQALPNAPLNGILPNGSAYYGWSFVQPMTAFPLPGLCPVCTPCTCCACLANSSIPEVGQARVDARPVSGPSVAGFSALAGGQRQTTTFNGTAAHAQPRPATCSGPAVGAPLAAGSPASASHAMGTTESAAGSWRMQQGGETGWTPAAAQHVAGPPMMQAMPLAPSFVGASLPIAFPPPAPIQPQEYVLGYIAAAPPQPWQQSFVPLQQQLQPQWLQSPRMTSASVATSHVGAVPAPVGHDPRLAARIQTEDERPRSTRSTVSEPSQLELHRNSREHRRSSRRNGVARAVAPTTSSVDDAVRPFPESAINLLGRSDELDVSLSELDIASDSDEAAYEPQHGSRLRPSSPLPEQPPSSPSQKY